MILKLFFVFSFIFISTCDPINLDDCVWTYKCCKKTENECLELCEPQISCDSIETSTLDYSLGIANANIINADCRSGFKKRKDGKCREVY